MTRDEQAWQKWERAAFTERQRAFIKDRIICDAINATERTLESEDRTDRKGRVYRDKFAPSSSVYCSGRGWRNSLRVLVVALMRSDSTTVWSQYVDDRALVSYQDKHDWMA